MMRALWAALAMGLLGAHAWAEDITVSVAVSLEEAATRIAADYKAAGGDDVTFTFGSSGQLAAQIKDGAPVDAFISAANKQVDDLVKAELADGATRRVVAGNTLVLIVPAAVKDAPRSFADLAEERFKRIAIGAPKSVPAGDYAMQTLNSLKLADAVKDRLVNGTNVRQVLSYVEGGDVAAGIVYSTDAKESGDKVRVVATADEKTHEPIVYPAVVIKASKHRAEAVKFLDYMKTDKARKVLMDKGFSVNIAEKGAAMTRAAAAPK